jgi:hypothetical protein
MNKLQQDLETWIYNWVSVYNKNLQAVPCPFAKQAYVDNKILVHEVKPESGYSIAELIYRNLDQLTQDWPKDKEVVVLGVNPDYVTASKLEDTVAECNSRLLIARGYIALEDHPDAPEIVAGESMNQGSWALVLVQSKEKLDKASAMLERQGYYKSWSQNNIDDVVSWRKDI